MIFDLRRLRVCRHGRGGSGGGFRALARRGLAGRGFRVGMALRAGEGEDLRADDGSGPMHLAEMRERELFQGVIRQDQLRDVRQ